MAEINFIQSLHSSTRRDYIERVVSHDKAECATVARRWGRDYWDGERQHGYGGYRYDGRWRPVAEVMAKHYGLEPGMSVLDVGCGKGYLLYELTQVVPGLRVAGLDISTYAIDNAKPEIRDHLMAGDAASLPFPDESFDFVVSLGTLHNLPIDGVWSAVQEIERVGRGKSKYIMVESFRNEEEKKNLLYWQLTCLSFHSVKAWNWIYERCGYRGDHGFIFFE